MIIHLFFGLILFLIGIFGIFLNRREIIRVLMSLELCLASSNYMLILGSTLNDDIIGVFFCLIVLCVAAAEIAIGLALLVSIYTLKNY